MPGFSAIGPCVPVMGFDYLSSVLKAKSLKGIGMKVRQDARELRQEFHDEMIGWSWVILNAQNERVRTLRIVEADNPDGWAWSIEHPPVNRANGPI